MTGRPSFGDFLTAARDHASVAAARPETDRGGDHVQEVTDSLLHVISVMGRYLNDITTVPGNEQPYIRPPMTAWGSARINARDALANAAGYLRQHSRRRHQEYRRCQRGEEAAPRHPVRTLSRLPKAPSISSGPWAKCRSARRPCPASRRDRRARLYRAVPAHPCRDRAF